MNTFMDQMKKVTQNIKDGSKKTMLKTDILFLEREIKSRKQKFGVEVYELMEQLETDADKLDNQALAEKESQIRLAFDRAQRDVKISQQKIDVKRTELEHFHDEQKEFQHQ